VVKKASFSMAERGLVKKVSINSLEMSVVKKSISAWLDWAEKKKRKKSPTSCQKVHKGVQKLSNISSNLVKINKKEKIDIFEKLSMIFEKIGYDWV
jgi:hypothetical protein